jgi:hypothetical protein
MPATYADVDDQARVVGSRPAIPIEEGISNFVGCYLGYYGIS